MSEKIAVLAKGPGECCVKGLIHTGEPEGRFEKVEGVETYIATPSPGRANGNCAIYFPDVHGFLNNAFLIMDAIARSGYLVLGVDYFEGNPIWKATEDPFNDPKFDIPAWTVEKLSRCKEIVPKWMNAVQNMYGNNPATKYACVGYCWGAPFTCDQLSDGGICQVGAFAHPANLEESHFLNLKKPLFLSLAQNDFMFDRDSRKRAIDLMEDNDKHFHVQLFSGISHGFALRGDMSDPYQKWAKEQSLGAILNWFDYHLSQ